MLVGVVSTAPSTWRFVLTGCGTSHGNPLWGLESWWSTDPKDRRRRSGAALLGPLDEVVLFDAGPDLAHQCTDPLRTWDGRSYPADCLVRCDAVLLSHCHADHCHGLNDLRHLNRLMAGASIPIYGNGSHLDELRQMFPYCFGAYEEAYRHARPALELVPVEDGRQVTVADLPVTAVAMSHGPGGRTTGWRCGSLGYLTDLKELPTEAEAVLAGLDLLVLSMLREKPHPTHLSWDEAQAVIARLKPRRTVLTHMAPEVRWADWQARLPEGVAMGWDGWTTTVQMP